MDRRAKEAGPELLVLAKWEDFLVWLLPHTNRWPKVQRFTLCRRVQEHGLEVAELLVQARYERELRSGALAEVNRRLERMRLLCRLARAIGAMPKRGFETAMRGIDETGRMVHGWRQAGRGSR